MRIRRQDFTKLELCYAAKCKIYLHGLAFPVRRSRMCMNGSQWNEKSNVTAAYHSLPQPIVAFRIAQTITAFAAYRGLSHSTDYHSLSQPIVAFHIAQTITAFRGLSHSLDYHSFSQPMAAFRITHLSHGLSVHFASHSLSELSGRSVIVVFMLPGL